MKPQTPCQRLRARPAFYGRLGLLSDVRSQAAIAARTGAKVQWDDEAGTVTVRAVDGSEMFKAIRKGGPGEPWLVMYNPHFYPRDAAETAQSVAAVTEAHAAADSHCGFFFRSRDGARVIGSDGVERTGADKVALIALPKFRTVETVKAFLRWSEIRLTRWNVESMTQG